MHRSRPGRRWLPLVALLLVGAGQSAAPPPPEALSEGVWWAPVRMESPYEESAMELVAVDGGFDGTLHFLAAGKKVAELPMTDIRFDPPELRLRAGVFTIEARVDLALGKIEGEAVGAGLPPQEYTAERRDPATIPGLLAFPPPAPGQPVYSYRQPPETGDGWRTATPEDVGLERPMLEAIVRDLIAGHGGVIHSLLFVKDGRLVLEEYFHGFGRDDLHFIQSCTKSVTSLLVGLAIDRGLIAGVDAPVLDFFPDYAAAAAPGWSEVRLEHLPRPASTPGRKGTATATSGGWTRRPKD